MIFSGFPQSALWLISACAWTVCAQYSATYLPSNAPDTTEQGQAGTNRCGTQNNQTSMCQNAYINAVDDFCLWGPPQPNAEIGNAEREVVSWCLKPGTGSRLIPDGSITGAHFVRTPDFVQVTGVGNLVALNIRAGDAGGELDPHGADGNGNPIGGLVFSSAFGQLQQVHEWTQFVSADQFCFRACIGSKATQFCQHIYDVMGCAWNMPANYNPGVFENCKGDSGEPMGVYGGSTFHQGEPATPPPHPVPSSSSCTPVSTVGNGLAVSRSSSSTAVSATTTPTPRASSATSRSPSGTSAGASGPTPTRNAALALSVPGQFKATTIVSALFGLMTLTIAHLL